MTESEIREIIKAGDKIQIRMKELISARIITLNEGIHIARALGALEAAVASDWTDLRILEGARSINNQV